jgi:hypothetical protein
MANNDTYDIKNIRNPHLGRLIAIFNNAKRKKIAFPGYLANKRYMPKIDNQANIDNRMDGSFFHGAYDADREFPLDVVEIKQYNQDHDKDVEQVTIHIGSQADEMARSMNALAVTIACDIFFRGNKFNTTSEEGRKLLAHELTHISQKNDIGLVDKEILEGEAIQEENVETVETNPIELIEINKQQFLLSKSQQKEIINSTVDNLVDTVEKQKYLLPEIEYLEFLCNLQNYLDRIFMKDKPKTPGQQMIYEIENKFRSNFI